MSDGRERLVTIEGLAASGQLFYGRSQTVYVGQSVS